MNKAMPRHTYRPSDLEPLTGATRVLREIHGLPCIEINSAGAAFTQLASAEDVPLPLRRYYAKAGKKLTEMEARLKKYLDSAYCDGLDLSMSISRALGRLELTEEDVSRLRHVNNRLLELEKSLKQMTDGMSERLEGLDPSGVEWDEWDMVEIILWLRIGPDPERPAYDPDSKWAEDGLFEPVQIRVKIYELWKRVTEVGEEPWGLDDGRQNHGDFFGFEGHQLEHIPECYLYHQLFDHADVGLWGMLHLRSIWMEVIPHRSGNFNI